MVRYAIKLDICQAKPSVLTFFYLSTPFGHA